jgi:hypothetical protein
METFSRMSLSSLNQSSILAASGITAGIALPLIEAAIDNGSLSFGAVRILNGLLYGLNVYATSQPGRIDGQNQEEFGKGMSSSSSSSKEMERLSPGSRGRTLVAPSGWAFAIWGPIFIGELVFCTASFTLDGNSELAGVIKKASGGFMVSQVFQVLWTAAFRPKHKGKAAYISAAMLSGIALSLNRAHQAFTADRSYSMSSYLIYFLPLSLHFGWTSAASLVNLNGSFAMSETVSAPFLAWAGHISVAAATALAVSVTVVRQAPVYGGVLAWALTAVATGMQKRVEGTAKADSNRPGVYGAKTQQWLCIAGAIVSAVTSIVVAVESREK